MKSSKRFKTGCMAAVILSAVMGVAGQAAGAVANARYRVEIRPGGSVAVIATEGSTSAERVFRGRWIVLRTTEDPKPEQRFANLGEKKLDKMYNVLTWVRGAPEGKALPSASAGGPGGSGHVEDGFDPNSDRGLAGRVVDWHAAGTPTEIVATDARIEDGRIVWTLPANDKFEISAELVVPEGTGEPVMTYKFVPREAGWWSVVYAGAPAVAASEAEWIFQPLIWQEKRLPNRAYLTEAYRCTVPATLARSGGITTGVVVDPVELPFDPLPVLSNSRFGVAVRNERGEVQPLAMAPMLGGPGSKRDAGDALSFRVRLLVTRGTVNDAFEYIAREIYRFRDYRHNALGSLNATLDRTVDYAMGPHAHFNVELRGAAYETDVPGAVKNISALHPLGAALVLDNEKIYQERALPMVEYAMSREKFLFTTNPKVTGQSASSRLLGPGVPLTEMTALYEMSGKRSPAFLQLAESVWGKNRVLNLDAVMVGESWQNALAMYRATADKTWLERAITGADAYIARRIQTPQVDYSDPDSRGMFFWTSYAPHWIELFELFEQTGEKRFLDAAREGARSFAQFIYLCPLIPEGSITVNKGGFAPKYRTGAKFKPIAIPEETVDAWRMSEMGLTCESSPTSKGHRGIMLTSFAPWMLRIAEATGDTFLRDLGRAAVIGRYTSFPGYHINTARTTVYEKPDFAERSLAELNSTSSLHYNHIWAQVAMLIDYLVSDVAARSRGAVSFPSHYSEGYAYIQSKVYGDRPGTVYGEPGVWLWMPKGVITVSHPELNYVVGRSDRGLYVAFSNQSDKEVSSSVKLDASRIEYGASHVVRQWRENTPSTPGSMKDGEVSVVVAPKGITVISIEGARARPAFQPKFGGAGEAWTKGRVRLNVGNATGMILDMGPELASAYLYLEANGDAYRKVRITWSSGTAKGTLEDTTYPFEWTVPLPRDAKSFTFAVEAERPDGTIDRSETGVLSK